MWLTHPRFTTEICRRRAVFYNLWLWAVVFKLKASKSLWAQAAGSPAGWTFELICPPFSSGGALLPRGVGVVV
eukprot:3824444-Karenia_brevis.AAC.1